MTKLKIVQVAPYYYPSIGGVEKVVQSISEGLVSRGHEVTVFTTRRNHKGEAKIARPRQEAINGVQVHRFSSLLNCGHMSLFPGFCKDLLGESFDILHAHAIRHPHTVLGPLAANFRSTISIMQGHSHFFQGDISATKLRLYDGFDRIAFRPLYNRLAKIIALTQFERNEYRKRGIDDDRIIVIPNAVPDEYFDPVNPRSFLEKYGLIGKRFIFFLGHFHPDKRLDRLIIAMNALAHKFDDLTLVLAGPDNGRFPIYQQLAVNLGLEKRLKWLGPISEFEKRQAYSAMELLALPSIYEAFGLVLAEAMASGKPVIATESPGPNELIAHERTGLLTKQGAIKDLALGMLRLLENDGFARELGRNARKAVHQKYAFSNVLDQIEKLYFELRGTKARRSTGWAPVFLPPSATAPAEDSQRTEPSALVSRRKEPAEQNSSETADLLLDS